MNALFVHRQEPMPNILFVCTANICRSPMAEALFADWVKRNRPPGEWHVASAGTWAEDGLPASENAVTVMAERGLDLARHRSRAVSEPLLARASLVLCMTASHAEALRAEFPQHTGRVKQVSELVGLKFDVLDPYGGPLEGYARTAAELEELMERGGEQAAAWVRQ